MILSNNTHAQGEFAHEADSSTVLYAQVKPNDLSQIYTFINSCLEVYNFSTKLRMQLILSAEDVLEYIIKLAYPSYEGLVNIQFHFMQALGVVKLCFDYEDYQKKLFYIVS